MAKRKGSIADAFGGGFESDEGKGKRDAPAEERVQVNAQVPVSLRNRFKAKAAGEGTTMSALMVRWIREYLDQD